MKTIKEYPNYQITFDGKVWSKKHNKYLKFDMAKGYYRVQLWNINGRKAFLVHRLVAFAFVANPENKPEVNHLDGNKLNNNDWNLAWSTNIENIEHAWETGLACVEQNKMSKKVKDTKTGIIYNSISEASSTTIYSITYLCKMLKGKHPNKTTLIYEPINTTHVNHTER